MSDNLKPCPFCGSDNVGVFRSFGDASTDQDIVNVQCINCGAQGAPKLGEDNAIAAWNLRDNYSIKVSYLILNFLAEFTKSSNCVGCRERKRKAKDILTIIEGEKGKLHE